MIRMRDIAIDLTREEVTILKGIRRRTSHSTDMQGAAEERIAKEETRDISLKISRRTLICMTRISQMNTIRQAINSKNKMMNSDLRGKAISKSNISKKTVSTRLNLDTMERSKRDIEREVISVIRARVGITSRESTKVRKTSIKRENTVVEVEVRKKITIRRTSTMIEHQNKITKIMIFLTNLLANINSETSTEITITIGINTNPTKVTINQRITSPTTMKREAEVRDFRRRSNQRNNTVSKRVSAVPTSKLNLQLQRLTNPRKSCFKIDLKV